MDLVLPSITAILFALAIIVYIFPKIAPVILAFFATVALVYGIYSHYSMFGPEYIGMTWVDKARKIIPQIMVGLIIIFLIGYLLFVYGSGRSPVIPQSFSRQPSPVSVNSNIKSNASKNTFLNTSRMNNPYSP
jgi:hypothetical protein